MAIVTRYFSTAAEIAANAPGSDGSGDSWANRTALFDSDWSTVITSFDFTSDSLICLIGPGTYNITNSLVGSDFTGAAGSSVTNPIYFIGGRVINEGEVDEDLIPLTPPNPGWTAAQPAWDDSELPVLSSTMNASMVSQSSTLTPIARLLKFVSEANTGSVGFVRMDWCHVINNYGGAGTSASGISSGRATNCVVHMNANSYQSAVGNAHLYNCRITGKAGTGGTRAGVLFTSALSTGFISHCFISGVGGHGVDVISTSNGVGNSIVRCAIVNVGGDGIRMPSVGSAATGLPNINKCLIIGCGGYGINFNTTNSTWCWVTSCRLRDNASGNFANFGNHPTIEIDANNVDDTYADQDEADLAEVVAPVLASSGNKPTNIAGDYRIRSDSPIANYEYGVAELYFPPVTNYKNFAVSTVATAPSPATTGTSLVVAAGQGSLFPPVPFNAVIGPVDADPTSSNSEIVTVTNVSTDTLTITREQEGTTARTITVGDVIFVGVTKKTLDELSVTWSDLGATTSPTLVFANGDQAITHTLTGNTTYGGSGYAQGRRITLHITEGDSLLRTLAFPSGWVWLEGEPTEIAADKKMTIELVCEGSTESSVRAVYAVEP